MQSFSQSVMGEGIAEKAKEIKGKKKGSTGGGEGGAAGGDLDEQGQGKPTTSSKKKGSTADGGEGKMKASPVVLRVDLHCHGCALKVKKAIKAAQGVEGVETDMAGSTVTVSGKPDPWELKERIESRAHKAVAFVSPPNPPKKKNASADASKKPAAAAGKGSNDGKNKLITSDDEKGKEPPESTVVVKIRLHCNGCIDRIKRTAHKIKGVKQVTVDTAKEHVTVKGTMDAKALPDVLRDKLKREVALVPAKKDNGDRKKQQGQGGNDGDQQQQAASSGKKKNTKMKQQEGEDEKAAMMYGGVGGGGSSYRVEMLHAPQLFSDENPNACSVM